MMSPNAIFILSLPRAGSTLLQKLLMGHSEIVSVAEPWIMLPLAYTLKDRGVLTEYSHKTYRNALNSLLEHLKYGRSDYCKALQKSAMSIYSNIAGEKTYFLDKTPNYFYIIPELVEIFPESKFIFLFRNPLSIYASMIVSFRNNRMRRFDHLDRSLYIGPKLIADGVKRLSNVAHKIRYEDLVADPIEEVNRIFCFLSLENEADLVNKFHKQKLKGLGDTNIRKTENIYDYSDKWKSIINTYYRKNRIKKYVQDISSEYLIEGGYPRQKLLDEVKMLKPIKLKPIELVYYIEELFARISKKFIKGIGYS